MRVKSRKKIGIDGMNACTTDQKWNFDELYL